MIEKFKALDAQAAPAVELTEQQSKEALASAVGSYKEGGSFLVTSEASNYTIISLN